MKNQLVFIAAAIESIDLIKTYTADYQLEDFLSDRKTQDAVIRNLEIIGQTLKDYGIQALQQKNPKIPWQQIAAMRNVLVHEYLGVDLTLIWETLTIQLDELRDALEKIRGKM
jgi:uncharacterized protein with HEPN domain